MIQQEPNAEVLHSFKIISPDGENETSFSPQISGTNIYDNSSFQPIAVNVPKITDMVTEQAFSSLNSDSGNLTDMAFEKILASYSCELLEKTGVGRRASDIEYSLRTLLSGDYSAMADVSADPNANVSSTSMASVLQDFAKGAMKKYCLKEIYRRSIALWGETTAERLIRKIIEGGLYPSDLHLYFMPYCYNYSASVLMYKGLPFVPRTPSEPGKHADTFIQHAVQLIMFASNHQSGACALTGFFLAYAWYAKKDNLSKKQITQQFQNFTYSINQPVRFSAQTPFLNLSFFDRNYLQSLYGDFSYPDGTKPDFEFVMELQKIYLEWFVNETRNKGVIFTFPVPTAAFLVDPETREIKDSDFLDWISKNNAFLGMNNIYLSTSADSLSSCCRLSNNISKLMELGYVNSFGAGGDGIGSVGVVTVSLPHVALESKNKKTSFENLLEEYTLDAQKLTLIRRYWVKDNIKKGLLPLYSHGFIDLNSQYCTVGFCGMYEAASITGNLDAAEYETYRNFAERTLTEMNDLNVKSGAEYDVPFNLEQVPAEGQAVQLAAKDRIQGLQKEYRLYSNQWIPLSSDVDPFKRIKLAGYLDQSCSGGAILHITTKSKISPEVQKKLIQYCAKQGVVYFAFNYILSKCSSCSTITPGDVSFCPNCGAADIEAFTRVVGFVTPVRNWARDRRDEFHMRKRYSLDARQKEMINAGD